MTAQPADLYDVLKKLRYDLTSCQAKLTDALNILGELHLPDQPKTVCPKCGVPLRGPRTLAEHLHVSHDGPVPDHYLAIDALAAEPVEPLDGEPRPHIDQAHPGEVAP